MTTIIEATKLTKSYKGKAVVDGIDLKVRSGEVFGILGPNGAGKTTTLEMLEALRTIDSGEATLDGINIKSNPDEVKQIIGVQLQTTGFYDGLTLQELLNMFAGLYSNSANTTELLEKVNLAEKSKAKVKELSGGQRQRFSVASALVNNPKVLFLDEPTTGLDPQSRRNLWELIQEIQKSGITIVLTTHYMEEAELLCDRIAIMDEGKIIAQDTPDKLINALLKKGFKKKKVAREADLEDVFIDLTGKDLRE